jgi:hypothetical protein
MRRWRGWRWGNPGVDVNQILMGALFFGGSLAFLAVATWSILGPSIGYYSAFERESFTQPDPDIMDLDSAFYSRVFNFVWLVIALIASALVATGMAWGPRSLAAIGAFGGILVHAACGWHVVANAADDIAAEFGYTRVKR